MRYSSGRIELRQGTRRVRGPIATRFRNLDNPGPQRQGGMAGSVRDGELLITERRHKQNVHLVENACHLQSNLATKPVSLHKVHRGKESRLTEQVGPRILNLYFQGAEFIIQ